MLKLLKNFFIFFLFCSFSSFELHDDLFHKIEQKTDEIVKDSNNAFLYFERGNLYQLGDYFKKAIKDYLKSEKLGLNNKQLHFKKAEAYLGDSNLKEALSSLNVSLKLDSLDVKTHKLKSKLFLKLGNKEEAKLAYEYVMNNATDLKPGDYINYCDIILAINPENYNDVIKVLDSAIEKSGDNVSIFQFIKLKYLKKSNQTSKILDQYNILIKSSHRKEFLYYEKAKYLFKIGDMVNSNIALQQAQLEILELSSKYLNIKSIKKLQTDILNLSKKYKK